MEEKVTVAYTENIDAEPTKLEKEQSQTFTGNVQLTDGDVTYLIPTPSTDPQDPLNLPPWRKVALLLCVCTYGTIGLGMVSGLGGLFSFYIPVYFAEDKTVADITALLTYPTLFMGIGNLFGMPLAIAIGRRPVFLASTLLMILSGSLCVAQKSYEWHLGARIILGLAAGQAEALLPLMVQETQFLHERAQYMMYYTGITNILVAVYTLLASYIAAAVGPSGWYAIGTGIAGLVFIASFFFVPETRYPRPLSAYHGQESVVSHFIADSGNQQQYSVRRITTNERVTMDLLNYKPRTLRSDVRLIVGKPQWAQGLHTVIDMVTVAAFPDIFWAFLLNGLTLGVNIAITTTYSNILTAAPYNWAQNVVSFAVTGQIIVSLICLPLLGRGSDWLIKWLARRNNGVHRPEFRLPPLIFPTIVGIMSAILYGEAAQHPEKMHWFAIVFSINGYFFSYVAASQIAMVYVLDSYPTRAGPALVVICAMRGILSFGTSYGIQPFIELRGYDGSMLIYAMMHLALGLTGIVVYFGSKKIRDMTARWVIGTKDKEITYS